MIRSDYAYDRATMRRESGPQRTPRHYNWHPATIRNTSRLPADFQPGHGCYVAKAAQSPDGDEDRYLILAGPGQPFKNGMYWIGCVVDLATTAISVQTRRNDGCPVVVEGQEGSHLDQMWAYANPTNYRVGGPYPTLWPGLPEGSM